MRDNSKMILEMVRDVYNLLVEIVFGGHLIKILYRE
jgi:hypothetical protein